MNYLIRLIEIVKDTISKRKTLSSILKKLLGKAKFEALSLSCSDPRQWIDAGSVLYGTSIEAFLDVVASNYGLTALHVVPKISALDGDSLQRCANAGCCFLRKDQVLLGVVTCVPERTSALMPEFNGIPRYVSSWKMIKEALEGTLSVEQDYSPLDRLFDIAQTYNAQKLEICSAKFIYSLQTQDGKKASGSIAADLVNQILELAQDKTSAKTDILSYQEHDYFVQKSGSVTSFILNTKSMLSASSLQIEDSSNENINKIVPISNLPTRSVEPNLEKMQSNVNHYVLLVDDNQSFTKVVSKYLGSVKIESVILNNGQEALDFLDNNPIPSVVVCDLHMPQKNGFDVVRHIRGSNNLTRIPIIMLTSDQDIEAEIAFIELGVDAFIKKNQDPRLLTTQIKRLISQASNGTLRAA